MNSSFNIRAVASALSVVIAAAQTSARENQTGRSATRGNGVGQAKAADCSPSTFRTEIDLNNVRALIETGGNMWQDRSNPGGAAYEVPKTDDRSGAHALFAGSLWMGGLSPDNQLKLAAVRFRQVGNDFWPGPLTNDGSASIEPEVCTAYDRTWKTNRDDVARQNNYFKCLDDPNCNVAEEFPGYSIPTIFFEWPAIGDVAAGQDLYIAPFNDFNGDGDYEPGDGDSPGYDLDGTIDCKARFRTDAIPLFGDENIWWVFNDKGNAHTETSGQPIGMEIRAQAFAFATNDEVNNMTFYNYVVINQGTQTLTNTYFGQWVDVDLGCSDDDYVGCDVQRGLGYGYNGTDNDAGAACAGGATGYGIQPPAIGVDFFEGPYQDADGVDNPLTADCAAARLGLGIPYKGIGIGYGDTVVDNERYGMRAFLYHNNATGNAATQDPSIAVDYYNFLRAIWKDNSPNLYGGTGHVSDPAADPNTPALYMFPGESDPLGWGTNCVVQAPWSEETEGNPVGDRRFIQSAGPFTLEPGAYNNITVGVVWARATSGGPLASVEEVRKADDKAQSLFDNCFKILNGPDAPDIDLAELDRELILYLSPVGNNNVKTPEDYVELDPAIPETAPDRFYRFQGYMVYQVANADVSANELDDLNKARLIYQGDIEDGIGQLVNYNYDPDINLPVPVEMVNGADEGIAHSIRVTEDRFAQGDLRLINFKTYYFMAIAYGYNNYEAYNPSLLTGQAFPFKSSRRGGNGEIVAFSGIPHKPMPASGGTIQQSQYGQGFPLTRLEGDGNASNRVELEEATIDAILDGAPWREDQLKFKGGLAPVNVKVVDPLKVPKSRFELWFNDVTPDDLEDAEWSLVALDIDATGDPNGGPDGAPDTIHSDHAIDILNEQLVLDWGLSVTVQQYAFTNNGNFTEPIDAGTWTFAGEPWCYGVPDQEGENAFNWIRSGTSSEDGNSYNDYLGEDDDEVYEGILAGMWAPWVLCGDTAFQPCSPDLESSRNVSRISNSRPTLIVLTPDKNRWTRCPVLENEENDNLAEGGVAKNHLRAGASVDKNGRRAGSSGANDNEATMNGTQPNGMGWFPGYAIDITSGERLNMAFSENSFWGGAIGRDFLLNPDDRLVTNLGEPLFGGCHWIWVFNNMNRTDATGPNNFMPQYDEGAFIYQKLQVENTGTSRRNVFRSTGWVGSLMMAPGMQMKPVEDGLIPNESRIVLQTKQPYTQYIDPYAGYQPAIPSNGPLRNEGRPLYTFSSDGLATLTELADVAEDALDIIGIVPNPYYSFSGYETSRLDNRVKFINLPQTCTIRIFNVGGTLIRKYDKDNDLTYLDWDLRNGTSVPIAGGTYICHIDVPGVGEKVIKWFGVIRPVDLQNF